MEEKITATQEIATESVTAQFKTYTKSERNWYLLGLAGQNVIYNIIAAALQYYMQFTILIPAMTVSLIMMAARIWDAFNDPMMGTIVDYTRTKWGKCRPYLMIMPVPIMIITIICFTNFGFYNQGIVPNGLIVFWAAFTYILWGMAYTVADIPLWGVTSLMTESEKDKTKLLSLARVIAGIGGGVTLLAMQPLALALSNVFTNTPLANGVAAQGERYGFLIAAIIFGVVGTAIFIPTGFKIKERIEPTKERYSLADNFKIAAKNKPFRQIILSGILGSTKMLIALAAMPLITYYFSSKSAILALLYMVLLGGGMFLGQFVTMAFTPALIKRFSTKKLYNWANIISILPYLLIFVAFLIAPGTLTDPVWIIICFVLFLVVGGANGITTVLQSTMIAKAVDYEEYKNYRRPDAVFFSGQTFVTKLQSGIATIISGVAYAVVGFSDSRVAALNAYIQAGGTPRTSPEYAPFMMVLFLIVSVLPAIGCLLSIIPTWNYCLDDKEHKRILLILKERRDKGLAAKPENFNPEALGENERYDEVTGEIISKEEFERRVKLSMEQTEVVIKLEHEQEMAERAAKKAAKKKKA